MKTLLVVLGLTAVLFSGVLPMESSSTNPSAASPSPSPSSSAASPSPSSSAASPSAASPSPSPSPSSCANCSLFGKCNTTTYMCECLPGYTGPPCEDIDECVYEPCDEISTCYNVNGSYFCVCNDGYTRSGGSGGSGGSGSYCEDIDECLSDPCDENATCINTNGSYYCICDGGYSGNGYYCNDINECELSYGICGPPEINQCINLNGTYTCNCSMEHGFYYNPYNRTCTRDLPVKLNATIISDRDGCYPEDIEDYIERVKKEALEILRKILDFYT